jgi:hypothetical protein
MRHLQISGEVQAIPDFESHESQDRIGEIDHRFFPRLPFCGLCR